MIKRTALVLLSLCFANGASAQESCVASRYTLPAAIADDMRPYLVCGILAGRNSHNPVRLNGQDLAVANLHHNSCEPIKKLAVENSDARLAATMTDLQARREYLTREFEKADEFLKIAAEQDELSVAESNDQPMCRNANAHN